jgi:hypothetical protein
MAALFMPVVTTWPIPETVSTSYFKPPEAASLDNAQMSKEIELLNLLTARKGELAAAAEVVRRAMALSLKEAGNEEALDRLTSPIEAMVEAARLLEAARVSDRPSGSIERRCYPSRGVGARGAPARAEEPSAASATETDEG